MGNHILFLLIFCKQWLNVVSREMRKQYISEEVKNIK